MTSGLLDTSIFIAREQSRELSRLPERVAVSVVTIGELSSECSVMAAWAHLVDDCRTAGVHRMVKLMDALIAATAIAHGLPVVTHDDDYEQIARAHPALRVVNV